MVAAYPLGIGSPLADPFRPTAHLMPLLELRARQLAPEERRGRAVPVPGRPEERVAGHRAGGRHRRQQWSAMTRRADLRRAAARDQRRRAREDPDARARRALRVARPRRGDDLHPERERRLPERDRQARRGRSRARETRSRSGSGWTVTVILRTPAELVSIAAGNPFPGAEDEPSKLHVALPRPAAGCGRDRRARPGSLAGRSVLRARAGDLPPLPGGLGQDEAHARLVRAAARRQGNRPELEHAAQADRADGSQIGRVRPPTRSAT